MKTKILKFYYQQKTLKVKNNGGSVIFEISEFEIILLHIAKYIDRLLTNFAICNKISSLIYFFQSVLSFSGMLHTSRPFPPKFLTEAIYSAFDPAPELADFVRDVFLNEKSKFYNEDHLHLVYANIGFLWTNVTNQSKQVNIAATAQIPNIQSSKWNKEIFNYQLTTWFGNDELDFLITIDANYAAGCGDISFLATLDHELYHCAQKLDAFGFPDFNKKTGLPKYAIRDHDVSEFLGVTRRWGADASRNVRELVEIGNKKPLFDLNDVRMVCGNCLGLRA